MGQFSQVPGLAGYQQQVAFNDQQGMGEVMKLSQLMNLQRMQQQMQSDSRQAAYEPEDRAMKQRVQNAQIASHESTAANQQATAQKAMQAFTMAKQISAMPDGPEKQMAIMQYRAFVKPESAFEDQKSAPLPWYVRKGANGETQLDPTYSAFEKAKAGLARPTTPYFTPVADATKGMGTFDNRTGRYTFDSATPMVKPGDSPDLQGRLSQAKETGKTLGEETTKAGLDAPRIINNGETAIRLSNELLTHPGFEQAVGASSMLGVQKIPGTSAKDFTNRLDQIKGGAFLEAFNMLKGGGQITEVEGKKATDAIARMDNSTSEPEFKQAVKDYQDVIKMGVARAKAKATAGGKSAMPASQAKPSMSEWMDKARAANPSASGAELQAYYYKKYGVK